MLHNDMGRVWGKVSKSGEEENEGIILGVDAGKISPLDCGVISVSEYCLEILFLSCNFITPPGSISLPIALTEAAAVEVLKGKGKGKGMKGKYWKVMGTPA